MESIWSKDSELSNYEQLKSDIKTSVAVIGGGIAGLITSYLLKKQGVDCILIEARRITSGVTQNTTAKITCQHDLIYNKIINDFGLEKAQQYAKANQNALQTYKNIIDSEKIDCNFEIIPTYLYTRKNENKKTLSDELAAMEKCGFKGSLTNKTTLPFPIETALKMEEQAQFNPLKFLNHICQNFTIYENTQALEVDGKTVVTSKGKITADKIVVATHYPFINMPGYYFMRMHQDRSYALALKKAGSLDGAYLGIDNDSYSFRTYKDMIILGGSSHRTGENESGGKYNHLVKAAETFYPESQEVCRWSAQDCLTHDSIPYIGKYSEDIDNLYVATGFKKWGMTSAMAAAIILSEMIVGKEHECAEVFSPQRHNLAASAKDLLVDGFEAVSGLVKQNLFIPTEKLTGIKLGHGGIIECEGEKVGVYKKNETEVYLVSTKCPHLGCQLSWNPDELSWDCPCHGSRFDYKGQLLNNPSQKNLDTIHSPH